MAKVFNVVLGIDGVSYSFLSKLLNAGKLPAFSRIRMSGAFGVLKSTIFPTTPVAWSVSYTGCNPAKTGIYGFFKMINKGAGRIGWRTVDADDRMVPEIWEMASAHKKRGLVIGLPLTYPVRKINGIMVGGHFSPDIRKAVHPEELSNYVTDDLNFNICPANLKKRKEYFRLIENRFYASESLCLREKELDYLMIGFEHLELAHHSLLAGFEQMVEDVYRYFDKRLGKFIEFLEKHYGQNYNIILYSDHGHKVYDRCFSLPNYLIKNRFLMQSVEFKERSTDAYNKSMRSIDPFRRALVSLYRRLKDIAPVVEKLARRITVYNIFDLNEIFISAVPMFEEAYDIGNSKAYFYPNSTGNFGGIYFTDKATAFEKERMLRELEGIHYEGVKVVRKIRHKDELYKGEYTGDIFDLCLETDPAFYVSASTQDIVDHPGEICFDNHISQHEIDGFIAATGEGIKPLEDLTADIIDIMPTIARLLNIPVPRDIDGKVIEEILLPEYKKTSGFYEYRIKRGVDKIDRIDYGRVYGWTLEQKEGESKRIIRESIEKYGNDKIAIAFSGGKDSTTVLYLAKQAFGGRIPVPVLTIDTSVMFKEIVEFIDRITKEWELDLRTVRNEEALKTITIAKDKATCCNGLKTGALKMAVRQYKWDALITAIRWDEQESRASEIYFSPRENPSYMRINPILHFREKDIWDYIRKNKLPYCGLYDKGYKSLDCEPCTKIGASERDGRAKEKEDVMERLRQMGYF